MFDQQPSSATGVVDQTSQSFCILILIISIYTLYITVDFFIIVIHCMVILFFVIINLCCLHTVHSHNSVEILQNDNMLFVYNK